MAPVSQVDFSAIPIEMLNAYLNKYDIVPSIYPSPASVLDPPPPAHLVNPPMYMRRSLSPPLSSAGITPANRPRRDPAKAKADQSRRRSSRLLEEGLGWRDRRSPILADACEAHGAIATIVQRHYDQQVIRESDAITQFVHAVRVKGMLRDARLASLGIADRVLGYLKIDRTLKVSPMPPY